MNEAELGAIIITGAMLIFFGLLMGAIMWCSDSKIIAVLFAAMFIAIGTMIIIPRVETLNMIENAEVATSCTTSFTQCASAEGLSTWIL